MIVTTAANSITVNPDAEQPKTRHFGALATPLAVFRVILIWAYFILTGTTTAVIPPTFAPKRHQARSFTGYERSMAVELLHFLLKS